MVHPNNSCAGGYGNCLDVKITNACNANCAYCIEKGGYCPESRSVKELAKETIQSDADTVLILGGEPTLYPYLPEYLSLIRPWKKQIYMTTNGSQLNEKLVKAIAPNLDGVNISIHHYSEFRNDKLYGTDHSKSEPQFHVSFESLHFAIELFHKAGVSVRINTNLVKGLLDNADDVAIMVSFARDYLKADEIRFSELQNCEDMWVDARSIWPNLTDDPYHDGCEQLLPQYEGIKARVKMACGRVNKLKPQINDVPARVGKTEVLYPDATRTAGWYTSQQSVTSGYHTPTFNCHGPRLHSVINECH